MRRGWAGVKGTLAHFPPPHLVQPHGVLESAQLRLAQVSEHELLPCGQLSDNYGSEDLTRLSVGAYARRKVHRSAEQVIVLRYRFTGVEANAHLDGFGRW